MPLTPWRVLRGALTGPDLEALTTLADRTYRRAPDVPGYVPTASSAPLRPWAPALEALARSPARPILLRDLGPNPVCNTDQAWLRRQFPAGAAPPLHAPHGWHQDGALGHHFQGPGTLLRCITCWCPLDPCGRDAPGIELLDRPLDTLVPLAALRPDGPTVTPELAPGDVLLMSGGALHRTHLGPDMTQTRTSVELRFYDAPPERLAHQAHVPLPSAHSAKA